MTLKQFLKDLTPVSNLRLYDANNYFLYEMKIEEVNYHGVVLNIYSEKTYAKVKPYLDKSISFIDSNQDNSIGVYFYEF